MVQYKYIAFETASDGLGKTRANMVVDVVGHSLGGHLADAFARLFPNNTDGAYTINGAGYGTGTLLEQQANINYVFNTLAGHATTFPSDKIINLAGDKNPDVITENWQQGLQQTRNSIPYVNLNKVMN
jgi:pimeloyl-ACP methyl ester carboxylesterase